MKGSLQSSAAIAAGLVLLILIWISWGQFSPAIDGREDRNTATWLAPVLFVVILGTISWMAFGLDRVDRLKSLLIFAYCKINPDAKPATIIEATQEPTQDAPEKDNEVEETFRLIREMKREAQEAEIRSAKVSQNTFTQS